MRPRRHETQAQSLRPLPTFTMNTGNLPSLPTPAVHMVTPGPKEEDGEEGFTPQPSKDSDSGKSYEASLEESGVSDGDIEVAF